MTSSTFTSLYIIPNDQVGQEAFAVIRDAMRGRGKVAMARVVLAERELESAIRQTHPGKAMAPEASSGADDPQPGMVGGVIQTRRNICALGMH
jgi:hypothetical protein